MRRYEPTIRVVTAFFAALLGFGLKNLLDGKGVPQEIAAPCFVLSVLLFLRFLIGSANHFWYDYIVTDSTDASVPPNLYWFGFDLAVLLLLGLLSAFNCYATAVEAFFAGHLTIVVIAIIWSVVYFARDRKKLTTGWRTVAVLWIVLNIVQISFIIATWCDLTFFPWGNLAIPEGEWFPWPAWNINLMLLVFSYFLVLCVDAFFGFVQLQHARPS